VLSSFSLIEELFHPAARHRVEERRRQEHSRVDEESGDPGFGPVDLDSGRVVIALSPPPPRGRA
jgi:hypothetical protein